MTSKKYINFEKLNEPTFNAYLFANSVIKETHHYSDRKIDLEIKNNHQEIIEYIKSSKEIANEDIDSIKEYAESLVKSFQRMDEKWTNKYDYAVYLLTSLQNMHTTNQLLLKIQEAILLIQRLEHLYQEIEKHDNDIELWRNCVRIAVFVCEWRTLTQNNLDDILIIEKYKPFVISFSKKLESMAYDMLFVQKSLSKSLLISVISTYFLINENSLISNLKEYSEKCIKNAVNCFYKGVEVKPALKRLSTIDPVKAKITLLTNIEKEWGNIKNISEHIYILSIILEEPAPSLLRETFLTQHTIFSNIVEKFSNQTPFEYFWKSFLSQITPKLKNAKKLSVWLSKTLNDQLDFILKLIQETFLNEFHDHAIKELILKHIQYCILEKD
ncbi:hypothetical protein PMAC_002060 [Pneumocystis sp. 'macacae']|nr:hypothetical protein PMAC_002060 [Pneumocystis sp. 'macacae']